MRNFVDDVMIELQRARYKHPGKQHSAHEGYAVLLEEVDEVWDEVKKNSKRRDRKKMYEELVQVAAMAQRMAEDLNLGA